MADNPHRRKHLRYMKAVNPDFRSLVDNEHVREHMRMLQSYGWSLAAIGEAVGLNKSVTHDQMFKYNKAHVETAAAILSVKPTPEQVELGPGLNGPGRTLGAYRIIKSLQAMGWTAEAVEKITDVSYWVIRKCGTTPGTRKHSNLSLDMYMQLRDAAVRCETRDPLDYTDDPRKARITRGRAARDGHAPLTAWDLDTIHLPDSFPDWTGGCGTVEGYYLHLKYDIRVEGYTSQARTPQEKQHRFVMCEPCKEARAAAASPQPTRYDYDAIWLAVQDAVEAGRTAQDVADEFGCTARTVERVKAVKRQELGL